MLTSKAVDNNSAGWVIKIGLIVCSLIGCLILPTGASGEYSEISQGIGIIAEQKSMVESWARFFGDTFKAKSDVRVKGVGLYTSARAAVDKWITQMKSDLITGNENQKLNKQNLEEAALKCNAFTKYASEQIQKRSSSSGNKYTSTGPELPLKIIDFVPQFSDAIIKIWKEYKESDMTKKKMMIQLLDSLKLENFNDIPNV